MFKSIILNLFIRLYAILLQLYPRAYRDEFADEMQSVFADAIDHATISGKIATIALVARELLDLPRSLYREYLSVFSKEIPMAQYDSTTNFIFDQGREPGSRRDAVLAALPHLLYLV